LEFKKDEKEIRRGIANILWHMRGGISREEAWCLSPREKEDIHKLIEDRMKLVEKTGLPLI